MTQESLLSNFSKWADSQIGFMEKFRLTLNCELSIQMAYPIRILEDDKAIEVRIETIRTRLGC